MPKISFTPAFNLEQIVYLITDEGQSPYMVIGFLFSNTGVLYQLRNADYEPSLHEEIEITGTKKIY